MVADGNLIDVTLDDDYLGVVSLWGWRVVLFLAELNNLDTCSLDIRNTHLEAYRKGRIFIVDYRYLGPLSGYLLIIIKSLYGFENLILQQKNVMQSILH